eukprot:scaffold21034_cov73-Cylindrotheca_fusiformis.AAC.1
MQRLLVWITWLGCDDSLAWQECVFATQARLRYLINVPFCKCLIRSVLLQCGSMDAVAGYSMPLEIVDNHPPVANALLRDRRFSCPAAGKPRTSIR